MNAVAEQNAVGELAIVTEADIVSCRKIIRNLTTMAGFSITDVTRIVTAVSELARNIYVHADRGKMRWQIQQLPGQVAIEIYFEDKGPGITDVEQAMLPGFSTLKSMGMGLPGVKRLMDDMSIESTPGLGTTVAIKKVARLRQ